MFELLLISAYIVSRSLSLSAALVSRLGMGRWHIWGSWPGLTRDTLDHKMSYLAINWGWGGSGSRITIAWILAGDFFFSSPLSTTSFSKLSWPVKDFFLLPCLLSHAASREKVRVWAGAYLLAGSAFHKHTAGGKNATSLSYFGKIVVYKCTLLLTTVMVLISLQTS